MVANPAPATSRRPIPTPEQLLDAHAEWLDRMFLSRPRGVFDLEVATLFGELVQAMLDAGPDDVDAEYLVVLFAKYAPGPGDGYLVGVNFSTARLVSDPNGRMADFPHVSFFLGSPHAQNAAQLHLPSFKGTRGLKGLAFDSLEAAGWRALPDTSRKTYAAPDRVLHNLGLERRQRTFFGAPWQTTNALLARAGVTRAELHRVVVGYGPQEELAALNDGGVYDLGDVGEDLAARLLEEFHAAMPRTADDDFEFAVMDYDVEEGLSGDIYRFEIVAYSRRDGVRENPDVGTEVARWLDSDKPGGTKRRIVSRPAPEPRASPEAKAELEDLVDEAAERAPSTRARAPRKAGAHAPEPDLLELHSAAAGDAGAIDKLARRYRRFVRKMSYAFLKAWSPDAPARLLASTADDVAAEVEQRVWGGTERAPPAIAKYIVGGKRKGAGRPGFSSRPPATATGEGQAARFTTWLGAVTRNVAARHARAGAAEARRTAAVATGTPDQQEALDEVLDFEEREALSRRGREQSVGIVEGLDAMRDAGKDKELEVLRLRQAGKSYKEISTELQISVSAVMSRLFRARKVLEELSGVELRGLVGELAGDRGLGGAIPGKRGRPRGGTRENPEIDGVYFEDAGDVFDLLEEGVFDLETAAAALLALAEYRPDVVAVP